MYFYLFLHLFVYSFIYLCISIFIYSFIYLFMYLFMYLFIYLYLSHFSSSIENREACDCPIDCQVNYTIKAQKNKIAYTCISRATRMRCLHSNQSVNRCRRRIPVSRLTQKSVRILHPGDNLQNGATRTQRRRYGA